VGSGIPQQPTPTPQAKGVEGEVAKQVLPTAQVRVAENGIPQQPTPKLQAKGVEGEVAKQVLPTQLVKGIESEVAKQSLENQQVISHKNEISGQVETNKKIKLFANSLHPLQLASQHMNKNTNNPTKQNNSFDFFNGGILPFQQMSKTEQATFVMNEPDKQVSTEKLIQQFESILSKSQFLKAGGTQKLFIKLNPEHLGALRIELIQKDSVLIAKMMTATSTAKDLLESQIQSLKHAFSSQNIQVEKIEISQQMNQQERFINRDSQPQQEQRQQREQEEQKQQHDSQFGASFEEALLNVEV
jgi:flagellar hook-length control protein FliK